MVAGGDKKGYIGGDGYCGKIALLVMMTTELDVAVFIA